MATSHGGFGGGGVIAQPNALSVTAEATVYAPASGNRFVLTGLIIAASATGILTLKDGNSGTVFLTLPLLLGTPMVLDFGAGFPSATADANLRAILSVAGTISGTVFGKDA